MRSEKCKLGQPKSLEEQYFKTIRPTLYEQHGTHRQSGVRTGRTLAEHLDSVCQFVLTVSQIAKVPEDKRGLILAAAAVHDLNKLDSGKRNVKTLARDREFLQQQLKLACVNNLVASENDLELVRRLIERHSGHNASDPMRFFPEDEAIEKWAAMLIGADLFDLGISEAERFRKVGNELTVAFDRPCQLFWVRVAEDRGYLTALLLNACEEVLTEYGLNILAIFPDGSIFEGVSWPSEDAIEKIASLWQKKIDSVFGGNIEKLVKATKDGIKIDRQAVRLNPEEALECVLASLEKKKAGFKIKKVEQDIKKWADTAGDDAVKQAENLELVPVSNAEEFAVAEALKAAYLSYRETGLEPRDVWDKIASQVGLSKEQRSALESFNAQYGRSLFAAKAVSRGMEAAIDAIRDSFKMRANSQEVESKTEISKEAIATVSQLLNLPNPTAWKGINELEAYINANPRKRNSLGTTSSQGEELISNNMPPGTKVQSFSNRLPGGMSAEPKRQANSSAALAYKLMKIGANFSAVDKQEPLYLSLALPPGSSPELLRIWRDFLKEQASLNANGGTITVDELQLYRDNIMAFKSNKVVGFAFPKRPDFIHSTVSIPLVWGEANTSVALLKSVRLALELSLAFEFGFPFVLSGHLEVESGPGIYGRVEGIPSTLQPLLGNGQYNREESMKVRDKLRCIGNLAFCISSPQKRDDCLYDLARASQRTIDLYYVLLRWVLREQDDPNFALIWNRICQPLKTLESLMDEEKNLTQYLKEAARIATEARLWGNIKRRTGRVEPFADFMAAIRSRKSYLPWDVVFAYLVQQYHTRLDRIREHGAGATKYKKVKEYYDVLREMFDEIYNSRTERILADKKILEAAYLFFLEDAYQQMKPETEANAESTELSKN